MTSKAQKFSRADWGRDGPDFWRGAFEGQKAGIGVTVLFYSTDQVGVGPRWHVHPYDEVFIVRAGRARFTLGSEEITAEAGQVLLCPAGVPHRFANLGPGLLETTDIHLSDRLVQTDLPDPED